MEIELRQSIYYSNKNWVPVSDVASSLIALDSLIKQTPDVLEAFFPGTQIHNIEVFIDELKSDSVFEELVIKVLFGDQQHLDKLIEDIRAKVGMDKIMKNYPDFISVLVLAMVFAGVGYWLANDSNAKPEQKATIEANNNTIINIGAGMIGVEAEEFQAMLLGAVKDKDELAKNAINVVKPAKQDPEASITFNENSKLSISASSISAMPNHVPDKEDEQSIEDFPNIQLEIRATDLDSTKKGWAVSVPELKAKRVKLQIDPHIDAETLLKNRTVFANVTIIFGFNKQGDKIPKLVFLRGLVEN